ncbi:hypothetical protein SAMN05661012_03063 [Chitinophaga sancti]|uniref:Uncharacterized protein n=1 Tax=Chitinophaga sancti TaxID=1004 RepID=A0A1K1QTK6_9BACT|nr:hypothetical protein SAMN05661012_03063 [Chitinophaga sancti]
MGELTNEAFKDLLPEILTNLVSRRKAGLDDVSALSKLFG